MSRCLTSTFARGLSVESRAFGSTHPDGCGYERRGVAWRLSRRGGASVRDLEQCVCNCATGERRSLAIFRFLVSNRPVLHEHPASHPCSDDLRGSAQAHARGQEEEASGAQACGVCERAASRAGGAQVLEPAARHDAGETRAPELPCADAVRSVRGRSSSNSARRLSCRGVLGPGRSPASHRRGRRQRCARAGDEELLGTRESPLQRRVRSRPRSGVG